MRRAASALAALTTFGILGGAAFASTRHSELPPATFAVERTAYAVPVTDAAVVKIQRPNGLGTGFHIGGGVVITAAHVVAGAKFVSLKTEDGKTGSARVVSVDEKTDIAILQTGMNILAASLSCEPVPVGEPIMSIGNPLGLEFVATYGTIAGKPQEVGGRLSYVTDMTTVMGQSGAAVFARGRVVGVVSAVMLAPFELVGKVAPGSGVYSRSIVGFGFVVPSSVVCEMLAGEEGAA